MNDLTIIKVNGGAYIDSREVAKAIGKDHNHLLRDIREYLRVMKKAGASKIGHSDFFAESTYISNQNKVMPCFLLSKMGCEMVANKLTGEKGILFTAEYIKRFNAMERPAGNPPATSCRSAIGQGRTPRFAYLLRKGILGVYLKASGSLLYRL